MSFAYLPLFTGDYLRDTRHLTPLRHGVYLLLLMHCWDTKGPAPLDEQELCGIVNCRSADEIEALRYVLQRFFVQMADGHYSERLQREIERSEAISRVRSDAGRKGYEAKAKQLLSKSLASAANPHPQTIPRPDHKKPTPKTATAPFSLPEDIPREAWDAFVEMRARIRKPLTDYAKRLAVLELGKLREQGHATLACLDQSTFSGWQGIFAPKVAAASNGNGAWWQSETATLAMQQKLGLSTNAGESWYQLRARIAAKIKETA